MRMVRNYVDQKKGFDLTALRIFGSVVALLFTAMMNDARALADRRLPFQRSVITEVTQELIGESNRQSRPSRAENQCGIFASERRSNTRDVETTRGSSSTCRIPLGNAD